MANQEISSDTVNHVDECQEIIKEQQQQDDEDIHVAVLGDEDSSESRQYFTTMYKVKKNFIIMSVLFSINHGAMVSCFAFATLKFGSTGAWQLALLHIIYASTALFGSCYIVKQMQPRNAMVLGGAFYAFYVLSFYLALRFQVLLDLLAGLGAILGGVGGALLWTSQGSYFSRAAEDYAKCSPNKTCDEATSYFAGIFAFIYLAGEVLCKFISWSLLTREVSWTNVILVYASVAILSAFLLSIIHDYKVQEQTNLSIWGKATAAIQLLRKSSKMRWLMGLTFVFGFAYPFINSYVNGEVVYRVLPHDPNQRSVTLFSAITSIVAAFASLVFGTFLSRQKGTVLILGATSFGMVVAPFLVWPDFSRWSWSLLMTIYALQGMGRATFEGALRATFADYFPHEREGAFANIILQNGLSTSLGFALSFYIPCNKRGPYCVVFKEGGLHNTLILQLAILASAIFAIIGYMKASALNRREMVNDDDAESGDIEVEEMEELYVNDDHDSDLDENINDLPIPLIDHRQENVSQ